MTYTKDNLRQIFQHPFNANEWQQMLQYYFQATELKAEPERIKGTASDEQGYYLGAIDTTDNYRIGLFYYQIQHGNVARKRVGLRNLVKSFVNPNWGEFDAALVVFDSGRQWRLSFVCDIKGESTAPKRYTYVFGEDDNYYNTPVGRFDALQRNGISFENIKDAFSVERLNKDFFNGYKGHYVKFLDYINDDTKENRDYVKKLLGRLVFLQFLQKKGWMGVPADNQGWNGGDKSYLNTLISRYEGNNRLLSDVLEPLFFNTLNEPRNNDLADSRLGENIKIPYLNGGLFDKDELDKKDIDFPFSYFKELMDFFAMYNFTIDENDPEDSEIGIDPEMLGHIFENLLEDNKDKGAFYTPKEIVQYMSQESVAQYLKSKTTAELHDAITALIKQRVVEPILQKKENARAVNKALSEVKVCDPAIGSGAFPMGVLNVLFDCRHLLYGFIGVNEVFSYAKVKRDIIQNNIYGVDIEKGAVDIARLRFWLALVVDENEPQPLPNLDFKIMQGNSLLEQYGDIDLSRLSDAGWSMKIVQPQADLFGHIADPQLKMTFSSETHTLDLQKKITRYFSIDDHEEKARLFQDIEEDVRQNILYNIDMRQQQAERIVEELNTYPKLDKRQTKEKAEKEEAIIHYKEMMEDVETMSFPNNKFFLWHTYFKDVFDKGGFDIVIGNPPYIQLQNMKEMSAIYKDSNYVTYDKSGDIYCLFTEQGFNLLKSKGTLCYIMPNKWMQAAYGQQMRMYLSKKQIHNIVDFGDLQIFDNATTYSCIVLFGNDRAKDIFIASYMKDFNISCIEEQANVFNTSDFGKETWVLSSSRELSLINKVKNNFPSLKKYCNGEAYRGILTGLSEAFLISEEVKCQIIKEDASAKDVIVPFLLGRDVKPYTTPNPNKYLILFKKGFTKELVGIDAVSENDAWNVMQLKYPSVCNWLANFNEKGRARGDKGDFWWELRACDYYDQFEKPKIMYQAFQVKPNFVFDTDACFCNNSMWILPTDNKALLGLLNSKMGWWLISKYCSQIQNGYQLIWKYFSQLPIALKENNDDIIALVEQILLTKQSITYADTNNLESAIDLLVYHLYGLTYDEVLIVDPETPITREEYEKQTI